MVSPTIKLNSGHDMPLVGFGLWKVDNATAADTVYNAIKAGYRLFDGACGESIPVTVAANEREERASPVNTCASATICSETARLCKSRACYPSP